MLDHIILKGEGVCLFKLPHNLNFIIIKTENSKTKKSLNEREKRSASIKASGNRYDTAEKNALFLDLSLDDSPQIIDPDEELQHLLLLQQRQTELKMKLDQLIKDKAEKVRLEHEFNIVSFHIMYSTFKYDFIFNQHKASDEFWLKSFDELTRFFVLASGDINYLKKTI